MLSKQEATDFFAEFFYGEHHIAYDIKEYGQGWSTLTHATLATTDFNNLTRLVFMAHEKGIRVEIIPAGPKLLSLALHKREAGNIDLIKGHPTIEQALDKWNNRNNK